eukprot:s3460_g4.t1
MALITDGGRKLEEYKARESIYISALVNQEAEMLRFRALAAEIMGAYSDVSTAALRSGLTDPTSNMEVLMLRQQARAKEQRVRQLKDDLEANRFDQNNPAGKALMQKCKALLSENRELGELMQQEIRPSTRLAELRGTLQNEQRKNAELQQKCAESVEFCKELAQDYEKLQGDVAKVAGSLRQARAELEVLKRQRHEIKAQKKQAKLLRQQAASTELSGAEIPAAVLEVVDDDEGQTVKEKKSKKRKKVDAEGGAVPGYQ